MDEARVVLTPELKSRWLRLYERKNAAYECIDAMRASVQTQLESLAAAERELWKLALTEDQLRKWEWRMRHNGVLGEIEIVRGVELQAPSGEQTDRG